MPPKITPPALNLPEFLPVELCSLIGFLSLAESAEAGTVGVARGDPPAGDREPAGVRDDDVMDPVARAVGGQYRRCWARLRNTFWHVLHFWNPLHVSWCRLIYFVTIDLRHFEHLAFAGDRESIVAT